MFDVGFSELIVIAIVALVVIGPERLPKVARTVGHLLGRMQRYVNDVKSDISREMQLDELKKLQAEVKDSARSFERSMSSELQAIEKVVDPTAASVDLGLSPPSTAGMTSVGAQNMTPRVTGESAGPAGTSESAASASPAAKA
ncbi:MAG: twin-arginine translocase subunit TatB [Propionivibrio sp.]|uniref:Sec-independent protein translocase protein TatB n=1 Tax=Propionivibrio sp. TaxID=2212460 RepID=UPI001A449997|nr:Sec-independent protein translocase protein TatB [Propionivibrio sp.]MBL8414742.1 twin-arginine translocase subunit TatB [Propionivibrio sp.]